MHEVINSAQQPIDGETISVDPALRTELFQGAPANAIWIGKIYEVQGVRELIPVRFGNVDFWFMFISPHALSHGDPDLLELFLSTLDAGPFVPIEESRLVKFCRVEAEDEHFDQPLWHLAHPKLIFQFRHTVVEVMLKYFDEMRDIEQFFYLPANKRLHKLYQSVFDKLVQEHGADIAAILEDTGACYAFERTLPIEH